MSEKNSPSPPRSRSASQAKGSDQEMTSPARGDAAGETQASEDLEMPDTEAAAATSDTTAGATSDTTAGATLEAGGGDQTVGNPGNNLYVANLATRVSQADLQELFDKYGRVSKCEVIVDPVTRESRGFGFVTFEDVRDAEDAVKELNNQEVQGRKIRVEHAKRKRGHEKTPGQYLGPRLASAKYGGRDRHSGDRSRDRGRRSRSRDRGGFARRNDDWDRGRSNDRGRGDDRARGRYNDRERSRGDYGRDTGDDRRRR